MEGLQGLFAAISIQVLPIASGHNDDIGLIFGFKQSLLFYFAASPLSPVEKPALLVWISPLPQLN